MDSPGATDSGLPPGYPTAYETDVVLADGATSRLRPIRPDDATLLTAFHARQSPQSIYYRYFSPRPHLSDRELARFTQLDYVDRFALVAERGDELIGVARYDRWRNRSEAEVAFFVDDANHGRGLATVMLEHLAARALEVGLTGFTASVLPENRRMIGVFTQAGFETATRFGDGVVEVRLDLQPTPEAAAAIDERARAAAAEAVRRLLSPKSVAVIGASREPGSVGFDTLENLQRARFQGPVWPVNPNADHVASVHAVASILDIDEDVDLAIVAVPADQVADVVEECGRKQVYAVVILSAGFAEQGPDGAAREAEVLRVARSWGVRVVGPSCLGVMNTDPLVRLHGTFAQVAPRLGRVALLAESGMVGAAIIARAGAVGVGLSSFVALGNRADVSSNDLLQYWEDDDRTDVVCLYLESLGNPRHFSRLARALSRRKPVVAVKAGWLAATADPVDPALTEGALFAQTGVIRVPSLHAMLDTARLLTNQPLPRGRRVALLGNAGGSLTIAGDAALEAGLALAELSAGTADVLQGLGRRETGRVALVDLGLRAGADEFEGAVRALVVDDGVDAVLVLYAPSMGATAAEMRVALDTGRGDDPSVPVVACVYGPPPPEAPTGSVPVYDAIDAAALALGAAASYAEWRELPDGMPAVLEPAAAARVRALVEDHLRAGESVLSEVDGLAILDAAGLAVLPSEVVRTVDEAVTAAGSMGYPVVLKAAGREPQAKTAAAGFAIDLEDADSVRLAWERMEETLGTGVVPALVQPMLAPGVDASSTVRDHPAVGPVLSLGPGGAAAALDTSVDVRVLPLSDLDAERLVAGSRLAPLLDSSGRRALEAVLLRCAALVEEVPEVHELRLNPIIVREGRGVVTDATVTVRPVDPDPHPPVRRV